MLYGFFIDGDRVCQREELDAESACNWLDLLAPEEAEQALVDELCGEVQVPNPADMEELEASSRYYSDANGIHISSLFLFRHEGRARNSSVAFQLTRERLLTFRDNELPVFRLMRLRIRNTDVRARGALDIMLALLDQKVEHLADELEDLYVELEELSLSVLTDDTESGNDLGQDIDRLASVEDVNGKVRLCLMETQRAVSFLMRHVGDNLEALEQCRLVLRDAESLLTHTHSVFQRVNFLMNTAQGFISIQHNQIIKIFSIAAVVFLPPTLVASIYGMNFAIMPELQWEHGYLFALALMLISGIAPYVFFKRKGWL